MDDKKPIEYKGVDRNGILYVWVVTLHRSKKTTLIAVIDAGATLDDLKTHYSELFKQEAVYGDWIADAHRYFLLLECEDPGQCFIRIQKSAVQTASYISSEKIQS